MKLLPIFVLVLMVGCSSVRYPNWEYVRIEFNIPGEKCEYKLQEACSRSGAQCFNFYKKRATLFGANTVVITNSSKEVVGSSKVVVYQGSGGANSNVHTDLTTLADYYYCPQQ